MNSLSVIKNRIAEHKNDYAKKYGIKNIGVFGSYAREEASSVSDIDILVEFARPIGLDFVDLAEDLEKLLQLKVHLVSKGALKPRMMEIVEKDITYV